jgi:hypothetical protein
MEYMRKFIVEFPEWSTMESLVVLMQNRLVAESLIFNSKDKKFLVTLVVEEV